MKIVLNHKHTLDVAKSGHFDNIMSYKDLEDAIEVYSLESGDIGSEGYNDCAGHSFEVYCEFWLRRCAGSNSLLDINEVKDTSRNKYQVGYDFVYADQNKARGLLQTKYRRNPMDKFSRKDLGTFISIADEDDVPSERRAIFTNLEHVVTSNSNGIFDMSYAGGLKQIRRVLDRNAQNTFISRTSTFWSDFRDALKLALIKATHRSSARHASVSAEYVRRNAQGHTWIARSSAFHHGHRRRQDARRVQYSS
jgi:hypothetical protein